MKQHFAGGRILITPQINLVEGPVYNILKVAGSLFGHKHSEVSKAEFSKGASITKTVTILEWKINNKWA